jgi:hypothetical protein
MNKLKFILYAIPLLLLFSLSPKIEASTTQYNLIFDDNSVWSTPLGDFTTNASWASIPKTEIINNSLIFTNFQFISTIFFWDNDNPIGYFGNYNNTGGTNYLGLLENWTIPNNATHFSIRAIKVSSSSWNPSNISFSDFQTVIISYNNPITMPDITTSHNDIQFVNNEGIDWHDGSIESATGAMRTELINIGDLPNWTWGSVNDPQEYNQPYQATNNSLYAHQISYYDSNKEYLDSITRWASPLLSRPEIIDEYSDYDDVAQYIIITAYTSSANPTYFDDYDITFNNINGSNVNFDAFSNNTINTDYYELRYEVYYDDDIKDIKTYIVQAGTFLGEYDTLASNWFNDSNTLSREGYSFSYWDGPGTMPESNLIVRSIWNELQTYDVTFLDWNNAPIGTVTVQAGETAVPPYIPTRTGYTFDSWLPPVANVQGDITTVAQYTPNTYTVTWTSDDVVIKTDQEAYDSNILSHSPQVTKQNHTLVGWKIDPTETLVTSEETIDGAISLTAVWEEVPTYTVTWRDVDSSTLKIEYVIQSGIATPPEYNAETGYELVGWSPDPTQPITQDTIFVAQVDPITIEETSGTTIIYRTQLPDDYNGLTDLFGGVFGGIIGLVMTLGTIDLFGIQLSAIIFLFVSASLGLTVFKMIRG